MPLSEYYLDKKAQATFQKNGFVIVARRFLTGEQQISGAKEKR